MARPKPNNSRANWALVIAHIALVLLGSENIPAQSYSVSNVVYVKPRVSQSLDATLEIVTDRSSDAFYRLANSEFSLVLGRSGKTVNYWSRGGHPLFSGSFPASSPENIFFTWDMDLAMAFFQSAVDGKNALYEQLGNFGDSPTGQIRLLYRVLAPPHPQDSQLQMAAIFHVNKGNDIARVQHYYANIPLTTGSLQGWHLANEVNFKYDTENRLIQMGGFQQEVSGAVLSMTTVTTSRRTQLDGVSTGSVINPWLTDLEYNRWPARSTKPSPESQHLVHPPLQSSHNSQFSSRLFELVRRFTVPIIIIVLLCSFPLMVKLRRK